MLGGALAEARHVGDKQIGPEHILIGIVSDDGVAAQILAGLGVTPDRVREALLAS